MKKTSFEHIGSLQRDLTSQQKKAREELIELQHAIREGRATTGNPIDDIAVVYFGATEQGRKRLHDLDQELQSTKEVLVATEFTWEEMDHGCPGIVGGPTAREFPRHENHSSLYRFTELKGKPQWSIHGLVLPGAHAWGTTTGQSRKSDWRSLPEWQYAGESLALVAYDLEEEEHYVDTKEWSNFSLPEEVKKLYTFGKKSETKILTGKSLEEVFDQSSKFEAWIAVRTKNEPRNAYAEAKRVLELGMSLKEYNAKIAAEREERKKFVANEIYNGNLSFLQEAVQLELHKSHLTLKKPHGITVDVNTMVTEYCDATGVKYE